MIKVVMCDLGGVYYENGTSHAIELFKRKYKMPKNRLVHAFKSPGLVYDYGAGKISRGEYWRRVIDYLKINKKTAKEMEKAWVNFYVPKKGMPSLIKKLRKNYKVVVVSGNQKERVQFLNKKYGLNKKFDDYFYSFDYGTNKPSAGLCRFALRKLKVKSEECIMIDDNTMFLQNVKKLHIKTIHFKNTDQLRNDLKKIGVKL